MDVTFYETTVASVVRRFVPVDDALGDEIVHTAVEASAGQPARRRIRELGGLLALAIRLRGLEVVGDDRRSLLRHGAYLGATWVSLATGAWMWATQTPPHAGVGVGVGAAAAALVVSALASNRWFRVALQLLAASLWMGFAADPVSELAVMTGLGLAAVLTAAGAVGRVRHHHRIAALLGVLVVLAVDGWAGIPVLSVPVIIAASAIGPLVLLALGWFDPRFAIAATAVWFWRLAALDLVDLLAAMGDLGTDLSVDAILLRWLAMGAGVIAGVAVSRRSLQRRLAL